MKSPKPKFAVARQTVTGMDKEEILVPKELPPMVLVSWEDAKVVSDGGAWMTNRELEYEPHIVWQCGFLIKDCPQGVMIVDAWHPALIGNPTQIPRGMIRSMTRL